MKEPYQILIRPMVTEKSMRVRESCNQYSFEVSPRANKVEIRQAVEKAFNLPNKVLSVQTVSCSGKYKRRGRKGGYQPDWKKAVVTLVRGTAIPIFEDS
jgi:large subunit ribosomal protein L23